MSCPDFVLGTTFDKKFTTIDSTGSPVTLVGATVAAYPDNSLTEITAGLTLTVDFDGRVGMHNVNIAATSGNGYLANTLYTLVLTGGTVSGVSMNGYVISEFTTGKQSPLRPTVDGRTLDVTATGEGGVDWANIGAPTTAVNLSGTSTKAVEPTVAGRTLDVSATGEAGVDWANVGGQGTTVNLSATTVNLVNTVTTVTTVTTLTNLPAITANWLTAAGTAADFTTEIQAGLATAAALTIVDDFLDTEIADIQARLPAALVSGRMDASVGAMAANVVTAAAIAADAITDAKVAADVTIASVTGAVGSVTGNVGGNVVGSVGSVATGGIAATSFVAGAIDAAAIATDAFGALELAAGAGAEIATAVRSELTTELARIDVAVSTRGTGAALDAAGVRTAVGLATANLDVQLVSIVGYIDTEVAAILAAVDTEVGAIKAKTDNLPASPAAVGSAMTLTSGERDSVADALLDRTSGIETGVTPRQAFRYIGAACAGKVSGAGSGTEVFVGLDAASTRLTITVDASGNRSAVTYG